MFVLPATALAYIFPNLPMPAFRRRDAQRVRLEVLVEEIIDKRRNLETKPEDPFQILLDTKYKDGSPLSAHEITDMLVGTMFVGHHTSAGTTAWILIEMLRHPEILKSVTEEIDALFGVDGEVTFESPLRNRLTSPSHSPPPQS